MSRGGEAAAPTPVEVVPAGGAQIRIKYLLDRVSALILILPLAPLFVLFGLAIKLTDGGPVFFVQRRPGLAGRPFGCFKFRTMIADADRYLDEQGRPTRERVTKVGKLLRWTSLDELPQLLNILVGHMSFVGPRPPMMIHLRRYTPQQMRRFRMKPGVTGLAQISGRNRLKWSRRIELDNEYIDRYSLLLDLSILLRTVRVVLLREGIAPDRNPDEVDDLAPPRPEQASHET